MVDERAVKTITTREIPTTVCGVAHEKAGTNLFSTSKIGIKIIPPPKPTKLPVNAVKIPIHKLIK